MRQTDNYTDAELKRFEDDVEYYREHGEFPREVSDSQSGESKIGQAETQAPSDGESVQPQASSEEQKTDIESLAADFAHTLKEHQKAPSPELERKLEGLRRQISGIQIRYRGDAFPVDVLVKDSGIQTALSHLRLEGTGYRYPDNIDFHSILWSTNVGKQTEAGISYANNSNIGVAAPIEVDRLASGGTVIRLYTMHSDTFGRPITLMIGLRGISINDPTEAYELVKSLFPNVTFASVPVGRHNMTSYKGVELSATSFARRLQKHGVLLHPTIPGYEQSIEETPPASGGDNEALTAIRGRITQAAQPPEPAAQSTTPSLRDRVGQQRASQKDEDAGEEGPIEVTTESDTEDFSKLNDWDLLQVGEIQRNTDTRNPENPDRSHRLAEEMLARADRLYKSAGNHGLADRLQTIATHWITSLSDYARNQERLAQQRATQKPEGQAVSPVNTQEGPAEKPAPFRLERSTGIPLVDDVARSLGERGHFEKDLAPQDIESIMRTVINGLLERKGGVSAQIPVLNVTIQQGDHGQEGIIAAKVSVTAPQSVNLVMGVLLENKQGAQSQLQSSHFRLEGDGFGQGTKLKAAETFIKASKGIDIREEAQKTLADPNKALLDALNAQLVTAGISASDISLHFTPDNKLAIKLEGGPQ